jgi:hypothetical protein
MEEPGAGRFPGMDFLSRPFGQGQNRLGFKNLTLAGGGPEIS